MARRILIVIAALALTGFGPFFLLPGGELEGRVTPVPADWALVRNVKTVQLETRPGDPYSVNIWIIGLGTGAYVHAGANRTTWVEAIEADARVRVRVEDAIFELAATRVTDAAEFTRFSDAYEQKYDRRPRNENVTEAYLFRLEPR